MLETLMQLIISVLIKYDELLKNSTKFGKKLKIALKMNFSVNLYTMENI